MGRRTEAGERPKETLPLRLPSQLNGEEKEKVYGSHQADYKQRGKQENVVPY
jgi:hypothetical protein